MYTGTFIENLIETVERAEQHAYEAPEPSREDWFLISSFELEPNLVGVA